MTLQRPPAASRRKPPLARARASTAHLIALALSASVLAALAMFRTHYQR